jgi:hypothetical protein
MAVAIPALISAAGTGYQIREQRKATKKAEKAERRRQLEQQTLLTEQAAEEERIRIRDIQQRGRRRRAGQRPRLRSTILTGPSGILESAPGTTGGKTLLGM